ncbi:MAG: hypothetical protein AAGB11_21005 [Pseudomonadota bacterium]
MRKPLGLAAAAALALAASGALAAEPQPLSFTVGEDRYQVPDKGITSVDIKQNNGLTFCLSEPVVKNLSEFTKKHKGEMVAVAIGPTEVFRIQIVKPYEGGCINWPLHDRVAANYRAMLTGEDLPK